MDVVLRIRELRDIMGYSTEEMAELTGVCRSPSSTTAPRHSASS